MSFTSPLFNKRAWAKWSHPASPISFWHKLYSLINSEQEEEEEEDIFSIQATTYCIWVRELLDSSIRAIASHPISPILLRDMLWKIPQKPFTFNFKKKKRQYRLK